jgi:hyperosmotically inducible periplasmic protein
MKRWIPGLALRAALLPGAALFGANSAPPATPQTDAGLAAAVARQIVMYPYYGVWDAVDLRIDSGHVALSGVVNQPFKKRDIESLVARIPGVAGVSSEIKVLPLSSFDDQLRLRLARAIYSDPALSRYAYMAQPPIHILVDNGHVTLVGVVNSETEKNIAGARASGAGLSFGPVTNHLVVENPPAKKS